MQEPVRKAPWRVLTPRHLVGITRFFANEELHTTSRSWRVRSPKRE